MKTFIIYYRNSNGNTETFRVSAENDYEAISRFHKTIGYFAIINTKTESSVASVQQMG